jgi:hypothetical protein
LNKYAPTKFDLPHAPARPHVVPFPFAHATLQVLIPAVRFMRTRAARCASIAIVCTLFTESGRRLRGMADILRPAVPPLHAWRRERQRVEKKSNERNLLRVRHIPQLLHGCLSEGVPRHREPAELLAALHRRRQRLQSVVLELILRQVDVGEPRAAA